MSCVITENGGAFVTVPANKRRINANVDVEVRLALEEEAIRTGRPMTDLINEALLRYLTEPK